MKKLFIVLNSQRIKCKGIWDIHKSDPDKNFPSNPHGDRVDEPEKLNLYTGEVVSSINRNHLYYLKKKDMLQIYNEIKNGNLEEVKLLLIERQADIKCLPKGEIKSVLEDFKSSLKSFEVHT